MIVDTLENFEKYLHINNRFKIVNDYLKNNDVTNLPSGKYELDGTNVYLIVQEYTTKLEQSAKPEAHKKYIDIQIVLNGIEKIGYTDISNTKQYTFYDTDKDIEFLTGDVEFKEATPGRFFVFYPEDAHMPSIAVNEPSLVKKAVFKIKVN